ncbi:pyruvate carboxylase [Fulvivirga sedimenti]|uniref:Pyruvate carboxylase n=1 Tax=Fulvivirga sedimenti TaxID=2879465 RepID=A0A9X1HR65_9BACT|nr:pyruvate carboxylase [Fulvivirga sedimenti]MCA6075323.1 pyruvate carboxylase [Fulvivirga sedimenti]MCA6076500.1 pyruvate carboxylase [Fulvivirga sedimenti]MCA6077628.1 pyruvate carboxylase [Fulvivirga sedimenti]
MNTELKEINKLMVANRGEIAIRILRAASELRIRTVTIFTFEDRYSLHRYKADEAYQIGADNDPLKPYLDIEEIISLAKRNNVDAIHPGYGFLSENVKLARRCREEGIIFVGPEPEVMERLGDKVEAKKIARAAEVPVIEDSDESLTSVEIAKKEADRIGFPVVVKAASGGGGRGMRVVRKREDLANAYEEARNEALKAFGDDTVFLEKFIDQPKHIEVQIMADNYGNTVHLFERDCSVQRRFQKVVEIAPSVTLQQETRDKLYEYALKIARSVSYNNVGTVEFLVDLEENVYFIEVNPRVQVEHTITEEITGVDIVRSQILIARGFELSDRRIFLRTQDDVKCNGFAIQCRITTEDPSNNFQPDYGTIIAYRSASGFGIRLDAGNCYAGVTISPFFDSLLVKVSSWGRTLKGASERLNRALSEFRIRGVNTNIGFLENVINHPVFYRGEATVNFINDHPELFDMPRRLNRGTRLLNYIGHMSVNGNPNIKKVDKSKKFREPKVPVYDRLGDYPKGSRDRLHELGREGFVNWLREEKKIQFTDTTFRDAHQSLLATRMRTIDMLKVAESYAKNHPEVFSVEMWGGATFDVCMRFLHENPWDRLKLLREAMPNILFQMLLRGSNAVGYKAYPDNLIEKFIEKSAENGIDIFRIFDSLNWIEAMKVSIRTVRERTDSLAEACICYTGDVTHTDTKYNLQYYLDMAKQLEDEGAHILAIKDMAGLLKPSGAALLIPALKKAVDIPIHLHTHDTSSIQAATYLEAIAGGVDVVDVAISSMSGLTSQPNFNSLLAAMEGNEREQKMDLHSLNNFAVYWEDVRELYYPFESGLKAGTAEVYDHEIPGGQYSNLRPQAASLGLEDKFELVKKNYAAVNKLFGDLVKVTPSSKVVGDMALFMTANNLTVEDVLERGHTLSFPESVHSLFKGELGQPFGGFPGKISEIILKGDKPFTDRPNKHLEPIDFTKEFKAFQKEFDEYCDELDFLSYSLYPKVFTDFYHAWQEYGEIWRLPTKAFFYGLDDSEEIFVEIGKGKAIIIKKLYTTPTDEKGISKVYFEMNGQTRVLEVKDIHFKSDRPAHLKVSSDLHVGSPLMGRIAEVKVKEGQNISESDPLFVIEAMKMESTVSAPRDGKVKRIYIQAGEMVEQDDLVIELE